MPRDYSDGGRYIPPPPPHDYSDGGRGKTLVHPGSSSSGGWEDQNPPITDGPAPYPGDAVYYTSDKIAVGPERTLTLTHTVLSNLIPEVFGEKEVAGYIGMLDTDASYIYLGIIFATGEQDSIGSVTLNGEGLSGLTWASYTTHTGDGTSTLSTYLTSLTGWTSEDTTRWKGLCHIVVKISQSAGSVPNALNFTATLGGKKIYNPKTATTASSSNPAVIAYHFRTDSAWMDNSTSRLDSTSWNAAIDYFGYTFGDSSPRAEYVGALRVRDPEAAIRTVLGPYQCKEYVGADGKVRLWVDKPPDTIDGSWSATASAILTTTAGTGSATDISAGQYVLLYKSIASEFACVSSITDDDTIVLDRAVTISGATVYALTDIHLDKTKWIAPPRYANIATSSIPDVVRIRYSDSTIDGSHVYPEDEDLSSYDKITELSCPGVVHTSLASRISDQQRDYKLRQPRTFAAIADAYAAELEPGDIIVISDDVLSEYPVMVLPPIKSNAKGEIHLQLRQWTPKAYSTSTAIQAPDTQLGGGNWSS